MGTTSLLKLAKAGALTAKQKGTLKKRLSTKKRKLAAQLKEVDQGLKIVGGKAKKRKAKRRAKR